MTKDFPIHLERMLRQLVEEIVSHPESLELQCQPTGSGILIKIRAHRSDTGALIGKQRMTHKALQELCKLFGEAHGYYVQLDWLQDPVNGKVETFQKFSPSAAWRQSEVMELLDRTLSFALSRSSVAVSCREDGTKSIVTAQISKSVPVSVATRLQQCIGTVFNVIGKTNNRILIVGLDRCLDDAHEEQPETAAGRFARE